MRKLTRLRQWFNEGFWSVTTIPSLGSLSGGANVLSTLAQMNTQKEAVKGTLVTTCDVARSLCKPVDDLAGRTKSYSGYTAYPYPQHRPIYSQPQPFLTQVVDMSDKGALMQAAKAAASSDASLLAEAKQIADGI